MRGENSTRLTMDQKRIEIAPGDGIVTSDEQDE